MVTKNKFRVLLAALLFTGVALSGCLGDTGDDGGDGGTGGDGTGGDGTGGDGTGDGGDGTSDGGDGTGDGGDGTNQTIVVGTDAAFPPFETYNTETQEFEGFDIDVMREVAERAGFTVEFQNLGFDVLIPSLQQGEVDAVISAMSITDNRSQQVDFSIPYYEANQSVMFRAGEEGNYSSLEDLEGEGLSFGAQSGTVGAEVIVENFGEDAISRYDTYPLAVQALKRGDVDAVVMDAPAQEEAAKDDAEVVVAFEFSVGDVYGIAVQKGDSDLLDAINTALNEMFEDGTMEQLRASHGV